MHLHRCLGGAKRWPVEQTQAQIDGSSVQGIDGGIEIDVQCVFGIEDHPPPSAAADGRIDLLLRAVVYWGSCPWSSCCCGDWSLASPITDIPV